MQTFIHGTDRGNAVFKALILIMLLSSVFIVFLGRIAASEQYADKYKADILRNIEQLNREIMYRHELY